MANKRQPADRKTKERSDLIDEIVQKSINEGWSRLNIKTWLKTDKGYSNSYSDQLMRNAKDQIDALKLNAFKDDIDEIVAKWESLYQKAITENQLKVAADIMRDITKIKGGYIERTEIEHKGEISVIRIVKVVKNNPEEDNQ